jgi:putative ABC transport system permease protein
MPDWQREVRARLSTLQLSPAREIEIIEELSQHLEDRWQELVAGGASAGEATQLTLAELKGEGTLARRLGALQQARVAPAITPGVGGGQLLAGIWEDVRYAVRTLRGAPGFTVIALVSLALGIGANTAIFSLWNGLLHASLPGVAEPERLVMLSDPNESGMWHGRAVGVRKWLTYEEFEQLRDRADAFSGLMASQSSISTWRVQLPGGEWEDASGRLVSGEFFGVLGVRAAIGRLFTPAEDRSALPNAVISYRYWQRRFGGRPDVLGQTFTVGHATFTIIGVGPRGFIGETIGQQPDVWLPLRMQPAVLPGVDRLHDTPPEKVMWLHVFGRLNAGVTPAQAEAQANAVFRAGLTMFYGVNPSGARATDRLDQRLRVVSGIRGASETRHDFSQSVTALLAAAGVLLLIACANLANLLLARGLARRKEIAIRLSLGASRGRLLRQLVTESLVLAAAGGAA